MGRPTNDPKSRVLTIRMSNEDIEQIDRYARFYGVSKSEIIRRAVRKVYAKQSDEKK